tara:strand:- start:89607 stop:89888 length:282 start_codon:yes stop_codon:yes gene_type:complete
MFTACENKGFQMTFPNGWTVSVQWGPFNYCENKSYECAWNEPSKRDTWKCPNAEIAAWDKNKVWYEFENDTVKGSVTPAEVLEFMNEIAAKDA